MLAKAKLIASFVAFSLPILGCIDAFSDGSADAGPGSLSCAAAVWAGTVQIGTYEDDEAFDLGVDASCSLYVAGRTRGVFTNVRGGGLEDMLVVGLDAAGTMKWAMQTGSEGSDAAERIAVASDGTSVVAGYATGEVANAGGALGDRDSIVARLGSDGGISWIRQRGSSAFDSASGIAMAPAGPVVLAGMTTESQAQGSEIFATKLDSAGLPLLDKRFGTAADEAVARAVVSSQGSVYVAGGTTGLFGDIAGGSFDIFLAKLTPDLDIEWVRQFGTVDIDGAQSLAVDGAGNAYVAAVSYSDLTTGALEGDGVRDAYLLKYDAAGALQWVRRPAFTLGKHTVPWGLAVDASGVYMAGWTEGDLAHQGNMGGRDAFVIKVSVSGSTEWVRQIGSGADDEARAVVVDPSGRVIVAGFTEGGMDGHVPLGKKDIFIAAFSASGLKL